jgi:phage minor structural protein
LQIIPYETDIDGNIITPKSDLDHFEPKASYTYYSADNILSATNKDQLTPLYESRNTPAYDKYPAVYYTNAEKTRNVSVKESNYFNALSTLSEQFQSWIRFDVGHDAIGRITHKKIRFKNYAGEQSWSGFRYGANLKSIKRTIDSKNIVTKMIVKNNSNVAAKNGFCSIARSPLNELGENFILNFDYYI